MASFNFQNCTLQVLPADCRLLGKVRVRARGRKIEWICPKCNGKKIISSSKICPMSLEEETVGAKL